MKMKKIVSILAAVVAVTTIGMKADAANLQMVMATPNKVETMSSVKTEGNIKQELHMSTPPATADKTPDWKDALEKETEERKNGDATIQKNLEEEESARKNADAELENKIEKNEENLNAGVAKASALAALHPVDNDSKLNLAVAGGFYKGSHAIAVGAYYRPNDDVMISMASTIGHTNAYNVGVSVKVGKSTKKENHEELYAMISEMKEIIAKQEKEIEELKNASRR